jgi:hypothetical protein
MYIISTLATGSDQIRTHIGWVWVLRSAQQNGREGVGHLEGARLVWVPGAGRRRRRRRRHRRQSAREGHGRTERESAGKSMPRGTGEQEGGAQGEYYGYAQFPH